MEKARILDSMKSLFSEEQSEEYKKFIEENFELG